MLKAPPSSHRVSRLRSNWSGVTAVDLYTVHGLDRILPDVILKMMGSAGTLGVHWYLSRPPIVGIEFEMDLRGVMSRIRALTPKRAIPENLPCL